MENCFRLQILLSVPKLEAMRNCVLMATLWLLALAVVDKVRVKTHLFRPKVPNFKNSTSYDLAIYYFESLMVNSGNTF